MAFFPQRWHWSQSFHRTPKESPCTGYLEQFARSCSKGESFAILIFPSLPLGLPTALRGVRWLPPVPKVLGGVWWFLPLIILRGVRWLPPFIALIGVGWLTHFIALRGVWWLIPFIALSGEVGWLTQSMALRGVRWFPPFITWRGIGWLTQSIAFRGVRAPPPFITWVGRLTHPIALKGVGLPSCIGMELSSRLHCEANDHCSVEHLSAGCFTSPHLIIWSQRATVWSWLLGLPFSRSWGILVWQSRTIYTFERWFPDIRERKRAKKSTCGIGLKSVNALLLY